MTVVAQFLFSAGVFVLDEAMDAAPGATVRLERSVSARSSLVPLLRIQGADAATFEAAVVDDVTVDTIQRLETAEYGALFRIQWKALETRPLFEVFGRTETLLDAVGVDGNWQLTIRFDSSAALPAFQKRCVAEDITFELLGLCDASSSDSLPYSVSRPQREAILTAFRMGYYDIPRRCTLGDVARSLEISTHATSERLRRGQTNLIENTLTAEQTGQSGNEYAGS